MSSVTQTKNIRPANPEHLLRLRREGKYCDLQLSALDGKIFKSIPCHKAILAEKSQLFQKVLQSKKEHIIMGIEHGIMAQLVDYMYTGVIVITEDNLADISSGASTLQLEKLKEMCDRFGSRNRSHHKEELGSEERSIHVDVGSSKQFHYNEKLKSNQGPQQVKEKIQDQNLSIQDEKCSPDKRSHRHVDEEIRPKKRCCHHDKHGNPNPSSHCVVKDLRVSKRLSNDEQVFRPPKRLHFDEDLRLKKRSNREERIFKLDNKHHGEICSRYATKTGPSRTKSYDHHDHNEVKIPAPKIVVCRLLSDNQIYLIQVNLETLQHKPIGKTKDFKTIENYCYYNGKIYCTGTGTRATVNVRRPFETIVRVFDVKTGSWEKHASLGVNRGDYKSTIAEGVLYAMGGFSGKVISNRVDHLKISEKSGSSGRAWNTGDKLPVMSDQRLYFGVGTLGSKIYVAGGMVLLKKHDEITDTLDCLDIGKKQGKPLRWESKTSMLYRRQGVAVVQVYSKLYVLGGTENDRNDYTPEKMSNDVQIFDPVRNSWKLGRSMRRKRMFFSAIFQTSSQRLYAIGGDSVEDPTVEYLDLKTERWTQIKNKLPFPTNSFECVAFINNA